MGERRCQMVASYSWSETGWQPVTCGEPATVSNGKEPPWRAYVCAGHVDAFADPVPVTGADDE